MSTNLSNIIKDAGALRVSLESEKFDLKQLRQFLARVERLVQHGAKKKSKERFERQMQKV
jgi:hypothetical protein